MRAIVAGCRLSKVDVRGFWGSLTGPEKRTLTMIVLVVAGLHVVGFVALVAQVGPVSDHVAKASVLTIGTGVTAYTLGLRHAFDADHIAAIDNTTRKLMAEGRRPLSVGFWFSLGHSTIVFALAGVISVGVHSLDAPVQTDHSALHRATNEIGAAVSGGFLYLIAAINIAVLLGILKVLREARSERYDEAELERRLDTRGLMNRLVGRVAKTVSSPASMYPIGLLFGLGLDTATEVALLVIAANAGGAGLPWYEILCLPVLFAAGMSLGDSIDGSFMNFAYGWAMSRPVRKLFYNVTITGLSVAVALAIGTIEVGGLIASELNLSGGFWTWFENIELSAMGFVIAGVFIVTWAIAASVWRLGRVEERWTARLEDVGPSR